uniref:Putative G-box-binding factor 1 n=1 Tax=Davidia involucrata TaxID=16924 RepID=A0A5B7BAC0_DAVIN
MGTGDVSAPAKASKPMGSGKDNKFAESPKPTIPTQEKITASQPDWSAYMQIQAYYGGGPTPLSFFTSSVASCATPYPYMWGNQGLALKISEADGKISYKKDLDSMRKCQGSSANVGFIGCRLGENGNTAWSSRHNGASQSCCEGSPNEADVKANQKESSAMKRSSDKMFADGANAQNNSTAHYCGINHQVLNLSGSNLSMGMSSHPCSVGSKSTMLTPNAFGGLQPVASAMMFGCEEVMPEQRIQYEHELKKERKRLCNKESARRSRIRREEECEKLQAKVEELGNEASMLAADLRRHSKNCLKLKEENLSLLEELKQIYEPDVISILEAKNPDWDCESIDGESNERSEESPPPDHNIDTSNSYWKEELKQTYDTDVTSMLEAKNSDQVRQSMDGESNSHNQESPSEYNSSPGQPHIDPSNSNREVEEGSDRLPQCL